MRGMVIDDVEALRACFRRLDWREVELPKDGLPIEVAPTYTWSEGPRVYLVFVDPPGTAPRGVVFHRTPARPEVSVMCEWCHAALDRGRVKLLTARSTRERTVGLYLCEDLGCVTGAPAQMERIRRLVQARLS
jgi:hypothetical protein